MRHDHSFTVCVLVLLFVVTYWAVLIIQTFGAFLYVVLAAVGVLGVLLYLTEDPPPLNRIDGL